MLFVRDALSPSVIHARFRLLAPFLGEGRVVGIPFGTASIVSGRIVSIEGRASETAPAGLDWL